MKITWIARSFLDYRIPVYEALDKLCGHNLTLIFNADKVPDRCVKKIKKILGERAIPLSNELCIKSKNASYQQFANKGFSIPYHKDLINVARATEPDVIVSDGFLKWTYASLWIRMFNRRGIKHVMCYERTFHTERNAGFLRTLYRKIAGHFIDAIDCNGSLTVDYVRRGLGFQKTITTGHMAADTEGIVRQISTLSEDDVNGIKQKFNLKGVTFIYVGRLTALKGLMHLLEAWKLANFKTTATLLLVGEGEQRQEIESFIALNKLTNVKLTGSIDYDNLGPYYKAADCFVIPTLEDNWSLVVPEAMAAGLPIVCSIYNGCHPELVRNENGWTFDPLEIESTANTLRLVVDSRHKLSDMGNESRKIVANYTPQVAAQGIYDACVKVLS